MQNLQLKLVVQKVLYFTTQIFIDQDPNFLFVIYIIIIFFLFFIIAKQYEILKDNKVLYNKLYNIDKYGHKKHLKQLKPIFEYTKRTMGGNKKREIIKD